MAITLIGNVGNDTDTTTEITLTHGVTINENDQILFFISCDGDLSNQTATPPSTATIYSANTMSGSVEITRYTAGASRTGREVHALRLNEQEDRPTTSIPRTQR